MSHRHIPSPLAGITRQRARDVDRVRVGAVDATPFGSPVGGFDGIRSRHPGTVGKIRLITRRNRTSVRARPDCRLSAEFRGTYRRRSIYGLHSAQRPSSGFVARRGRRSRRMGIGTGREGWAVPCGGGRPRPCRAHGPGTGRSGLAETAHCRNPLPGGEPRCAHGARRLRASRDGHSGSWARPRRNGSAPWFPAPRPRPGRTGPDRTGPAGRSHTPRSASHSPVVRGFRPSSSWAEFSGLMAWSGRVPIAR